MLTTRYVPGSPVWLDISTPDLDAAARFYQAVLGWTHQPGGPEFGGYGLFQLDGKTVAGGMTVPADQGPTAWNLYFQTTDADRTAATVQSSGGTVIAEPMDVMDLGRMAVLADPQGAGFAVWQPGTNKGLDLVDAPDALFWVELNTSDVPAAVAFYTALFGWGTTTMPMPGGGEGPGYTMIHPEGQTADDMFGGIAPLDTEGPLDRPTWLPYFLAQDCDTTVGKARDAGGTITMEPVDMPGVGRFALIDDPTGARFFVMTPSPQQA